MTASERNFFLLLIVNCILVVLYLVWMLGIRNRIRKMPPKKAVFIRALIMFLCPAVGVLFFSVGFLLEQTVFRSPVDLEDVIFNKDRVTTYSFADEDQERNFVPLEEAIAVSDTANLRSLMMSVVRRDIQESLAAIAFALDSEDSETSHYAAAVLQEALDDFRTNVQKGYQEIMEEPQKQLRYAHLLFDYMNPVLRQKVFTQLEQKSMVSIMDQIADVLYTHDHRSMTSQQFEAISMRLLEIDDYENCQKWCERGEYQFPSELSTYTCQLKLYFTTGSRKKFFRVLSDLKDSDIIVDNETLELIRVFL